MRSLAFFLFVSITQFALAQSSLIKEVNLQVSSSNQVLVNWVMYAGASCNSPQVQHSLNGSDFRTVYTYPGVCGVSSEESSYSWVHKGAKKFAINFYRIRVDEAEKTEAVKVDLQSILSERELIVYPNPIGNNFSLELRNEDNQFFDVQIFDQLGVLRFEEKQLLGTQHLFSIEELEQGVFFLKIKFENGEEQVERVLKL